MKTTIISVLYRDYGTFNYMLQTALAGSDNIVEVLVCDNANNTALANKWKSDARVKFIKGINDSINTSMNHGVGINKLMPMVNTPIVALLEPDIMLLSRGWDELADGIDLKACAKAIYNGIPAYYPCFMVGRTEKLKNIDFTPTGEGLPKEGGKYADTGWRCSISGLKVEELEYKNCVAGNCSIIPNKVFEKKTNEFWANGKPIAAHLWRGSEPQRRGGQYKHHINVWRSTADKVLQDLKK